MPIALILDTNVLRQEGLNSRNMQILRRLTSSGEVDLLVHEVVAREFKSQRTLEVQAQVEKIADAITEMGRQVDAKGASHRDLTEMRSRFAEIAETAKKEVETDFTAWLKWTGAHLIPFEPEGMRQVLEDYFLGAGAFRKPKHRDDMPDAIVATGIKAMLSKYQNLHIAVKDGAFRRHLQTEPMYTLVDGLTEFFTLEMVAQITKALDGKEKDLDAQIKLFASEAVKTRIVEYIRNAKDLLDDVYVEEENITGLEVLEMQIFGASLNYAQASAISNVDFGEPTLVDSGHFSIPVTISTRAQIHYGASYGEVAQFEGSRAIDIWSMDGEGLCDLIEPREVELIGFLDLRFTPELTPEVLEVHTEYLQAEKPKIEIGLEISTAKVH
jgi:PIN domain